MGALLLLLLLEVFVTLFAQRDTPCVTPNGENAMCVPVGSCKVIFSALLTGDESAKQFAQESQCGHDGVPLVCCGSLSYLTTPPTPTTPMGVVLVNFNTKQLPDRTVCGLGSKETRIIGGEITDLEEFPWLAALKYKRKSDDQDGGIRCGGSIVNNHYILTAAHCMVSGEFELDEVWLGEWKISTDPDCREKTLECADKVEKFQIAETIPHPFYSGKSGDNDIGLLKLAREIEYTDYIRPICMPPSNLPSPKLGDYLTVAGWGATGSNSNTSDVKLKVGVPLVSNEVCIEKLEKQMISSNQLCAGGEQGKDSCQGDSGGPLMRIYEDQLSKQTNQWYQEGVVAWGVGCGGRGYPAIYTRVSKYILWILKHLDN